MELLTVGRLKFKQSGASKRGVDEVDNVDEMDKLVH